MRRLLLVLVLVVVAGGCAEPAVELADYPCDATSTLTYETFGRAFFDAHCDRCHSASPGDRHGAPESFRFDTLDDVQRHRARIFARSAATNTSMPVGPDDPAPDEREALATWLACGAR